MLENGLRLLVSDHSLGAKKVVCDVAGTFAGI